MKNIVFILLVFFQTFAAFSDDFVFSASKNLNWKVLIVSASNDDNLANWDNAREAVCNQMIMRGIPANNIFMLSAHENYIGKGYKGIKVKKAYTYNMTFALEDMKLTTGDAVLFYISSHGAKDGGISLKTNNSFIGIDQMNNILSTIPSDIPTVLCISTCYSGQFIQGSIGKSSSTIHDLQAPNRIILTAARNDRSSFGCGSGNFMPEWDDSFIKIISTSKNATLFKDIANALTKDIAEKEKGWAESSSSHPQAFFGSEVSDLQLPNFQ